MKTLKAAFFLLVTVVAFSACEEEYVKPSSEIQDVQLDDGDNAPNPMAPA